MRSCTCKQLVRRHLSNGERIVIKTRRVAMRFRGRQGGCPGCCPGCDRVCPGWATRVTLYLAGLVLGVLGVLGGKATLFTHIVVPSRV